MLRIVLMLVGLSLAGCTSIQKYNQGSDYFADLPKEIRKVNKKLQDRKAIIFLKDGRIARGIDVQIEGEQTSWIAGNRPQRFNSETSNVARIDIIMPKRWKTVGFAAGFVAGWVLTEWTWRESTFEVSFWEPAFLHFLTGASAAFLGGAIGDWSEKVRLKTVYESQLMPAHGQ